MQVTAWSNGGSGYGLKIRKGDLKNFKREWGIVIIELPIGKEVVKAKANIDKDSFWKFCNELISKDIRLWLERKGLLNWKKGSPPKFEMKHVGRNIFRIEK